MTSTSPIIISSSPPPSIITIPSSPHPHVVAPQPAATVERAARAPAPAVALGSSRSPTRNPPGRDVRSGIFRSTSPPRARSRRAASVSPLASRSTGSTHQGLRSGVIELIRRPSTVVPAQIGSLARGPGFQPRPNLRTGASANPTPSGPTRTTGGTGGYSLTALPRLRCSPPPYSSPPSVPSSPAPSSPGFTIVRSPALPSHGSPDLAPPATASATSPSAPSTPPGAAASPLHPSQLPPPDWEHVDYLADMPRVELPIWDEEDGPAGADRDALASSDEDDHSGNHGHGWDNERS
ncbi:hypothetical protein V8E36_001402 [Tilletia maclaganii]